MRFLVVLLYLAVLAGLKLFRGGVNTDQIWIIGALIVGFMLGWLLPELDGLIYVYTYPQELTSVRVLELIKLKRFGEAYKLLRDTKNERKRLILHSIIFQAVFWVFGFWVITSSGNFLGRGLVLGAMLNFLFWDWEKYKSNDMESIFWQVKRVVEIREAKILIIIMGVILGYLTWVSV